MNLNPPVLPVSPSMRSSQLDPSNPNPNPNSPQHPPPPPAAPAKKKRNLPGTPDPDAEVIALSPQSLMATNRFVCEVCGKGFQRDQNLQLHRRGHNLPWRLRQRGVGKEAPRKKVYLCPVETCVHHDRTRALGDLTGIKKHYSRKHGEKKWKCHKCNKRYAVQSDWKAHSKTCGTKEYSCDCGTVFSRKDSFVTHRAFCDALVQETARLSGDGDPRSGSFAPSNGATLVHHSILHQRPQIQEHKSIPNPFLLDHSHQLSTMQEQIPNSNLFIPQVLQINDSSMPIFSTECKAPAPATTGAYNCLPETPSSSSAAAAAMSATALLQKATQIGSSASQASPPSLFAGIGAFSGGHNTDGNTCFSATGHGSSPVGDEFGGCTRDFLGVGTEECCLKRPPPELAGYGGMSAMDVLGASLGYRS